MTYLGHICLANHITYDDWLGGPRGLKDKLLLRESQTRSSYLAVLTREQADCDVCSYDNLAFKQIWMYNVKIPLLLSMPKYVHCPEEESTAGVETLGYKQHVAGWEGSTHHSP